MKIVGPNYTTFSVSVMAIETMADAALFGFTENASKTVSTKGKGGIGGSGARNILTPAYATNSKINVQGPRTTKNDVYWKFFRLTMPKYFRLRESDELRLSTNLENHIRRIRTSVEQAFNTYERAEDSFTRMTGAIGGGGMIAAVPAIDMIRQQRDDAHVALLNVLRDQAGIVLPGAATTVKSFVDTIIDEMFNSSDIFVDKIVLPMLQDMLTP